MSNIDDASVRLLEHLQQDSAPETGTSFIVSNIALRTLIEHLSGDQPSFVSRYGITQRQLTARMSTVAEQYIGDLAESFSLVLVFARSIEISTQISETGALPSLEQLVSLQEVMDRCPGFGRRILQLFDVQVGGRSLGRVFRNNVECLDLETVELHRIGTTSLIFRIASDMRRDCILKVCHVLLTNVGPIAQATENYYDKWGHLSVRCEATAEIFASGAGWVCEEFLEGKTLRELVESGYGNGNLDMVASLFGPIVDAIAQFHSESANVGHGDLSPSNIILQPGGDGRYRARLIDLGPNLLASRSIGRVTAPEARFIGPETRDLSTDDRAVSTASDYFSLGYILPYCLGWGRQDALLGLDDRYVALCPELAKLSAGLITALPPERLAEVGFSDLSSLKAAAVKLATLSSVALQSGSSASAGLRDLGSIGSISEVRGAVRRLRAVAGSGNPYSTLVGPLRICVAALCLTVGTLVLLWSVLVEVAPDVVPLSKQFIDLGFDPQRQSENFEMQLVGISFLYACFQYNVLAFGGVTFYSLRLPKLLKLLSEAVLWLLTGAVLICILYCTFVTPRAWMLASGIGVAVVAANNLITRRFDGVTLAAVERMTDSRTLNLREAPAFQIDILRSWNPTSTVYAVVILTLGSFSLDGSIHDWKFWAVTLSMVNFFVLGRSQATLQGPRLRSRLTQIVVVGGLPSVRNSAGA